MPWLAADQDILASGASWFPRATLGSVIFINNGHDPQTLLLSMIANFTTTLFLASLVSNEDYQILFWPRGYKTGMSAIPN